MKKRTFSSQSKIVDCQEMLRDYSKTTDLLKKRSPSLGSVDSFCFLSQKKCFWGLTTFGQNWHLTVEKRTFASQSKIVDCQEMLKKSNWLFENNRLAQKGVSLARFGWLFLLFVPKNVLLASHCLRSRKRFFVKKCWRNFEYLASWHGHATANEGTKYEGSYLKTASSAKETLK